MDNPKVLRISRFPNKIKEDLVRLYFRGNIYVPSPVSLERWQLNWIQDLPERVHNGAFTERGVAGITVSPSRLHNVWKGKRLLSIQKLDRVLPIWNWTFWT
jgi:hypothetical protein